MWLLIRLQKHLLNFCGKVTSWSSEYWPNSWVTKEPTLRATSSVSCVSSWAFGRQELCLTTPRLMDKWNEPTKCWCRWLGNWVKIRRQTGLNIYQSWCMVTTPQDQPSWDIARTIWCLGDDHTYPLTFIFPLSWAQKSTSMSTTTLLPYVSDCEAFKEVQVQSTSEAERQRWYYNHKANAISLEPGDLVLAKANAYKGRRKVKDQWEEELYKVECRIAEGIPFYLMKNQQTGYSWVLHWNWLFLITSMMGAPLCSGVWAEWTRCTATVLEEPAQKVSKNEEAP